MSYQNYVSRKEGNELGAGYVAKVREKFPSAILDEERQTADQLTNGERSLNGDYAVYYALSMEEGEKCWIVVKAHVSPITLEFPSVTPRVPAAVWGEREIRDMYGLIPVGLPDERRLVLPDDWPEDMYR